MIGLWIGILAGAVAVLALVFSFSALRRTRRAILRFPDPKKAPEVPDQTFLTVAGREIDLDDLRGTVTVLVAVPERALDSHRFASYELLRHRHGAADVSVVAVPIGERVHPATRRAAGTIPMLAAAEEHPWNEKLRSVLGDLDEPFSALVIDAEGRVRARFSGESDPRNVEMRRTLESALQN